MSQDGFGTRTLSTDPETGEPVEILTFAPALARGAEFASAIAERVARLARVRHAMYARTRRIEQHPIGTLRLFSDHVPGWRLDRVLDTIEHEGWVLDITAIVTMLRQLIPAAALFSRHQRDATIGTIGPERLILTPQGRLVIAEYVLAPGLERLQVPRERLWREFRVAIPHEAAVSRIPPSGDVVGIGVVAISLLLGRRLKDDEFLVSLGDLVETLTETSAGSTKKLSGSMCTWLGRALQFESDRNYQSVPDAQVAFEQTLAREKSYVTTAVQLERFVGNLARVLGPPAAAPMPAAEATDAEMPEDIAAAVTADRDARRQSSARHAVASAPAPAAAPTVVASPNSRASSGRHPVAAPAQESAATAPALRVSSSDSSGRLAAAPSTSAVVRATDAVTAIEALTAAPVTPDAPNAPSALSAPSAPRAPSGSAASSSRPTQASRFALPGLAAVVLLQGAVIAWLLLNGSAPGGGGEISIQSRPAAARVSIDGEERGVTPFQSPISPGSHVVEVRVGRSEPRVIPIVVREGVQTGLYVELQSVATVGGLEVRSEPLKARVTVAGQFRGETPLVIKDLPPGDVEVVVQGGNREVKQTVRIEPGITSQLVVPLGR